jgi:hypothetical protein
LLSYRRFAYLLSRSSPSALAQPSSRSLASNMVSWLPTRVQTCTLLILPFFSSRSTRTRRGCIFSPWSRIGFCRRSRGP